MKKFITFLLALSMVISLLPATLAADTETKSDVTVVYSIAGMGHRTKVSTIDYVMTNGFWKYHSSNKPTGIASSEVKYGAIWMTNYGSGAGLDGGNGGWIAYEINVPQSGKYDVYLDYKQFSDKGSVGGLYIMPYTANIVSGLSNPDYCVTNYIQYHNASVTASNGTLVGSTKIGGYNFTSDGKWIVVYKQESLNAGATYGMYPATLTLNGGPGFSRMLYTNVDNSAIEKEQTTQITAAVYNSSTAAAITDETFDITYTSSNEKIATVDETGLVTGVGMGKATITVTAKNEAVGYSDSETVDVTVTSPDASGVKVEYDMKSPGVGTNIGDITYEKAKGLWKYASSSNGTKFKSVNANDCLSLEAYGGAGGYVAIAINVPVKGDYNLTFEHLKYKSGTTQGAMYIAPVNVPLTDVVNDTKYLVTDKINYNEPDTSKIYINSIDLGPVSFESAGEYNVVYKALVNGEAMYPGDIILNGGAGAAYVGTVTATDTELKVGDIITPTAAVYNSSTGTEITSGVTLTSSNPAVARIEEDGTTVKAVGAGKTTISATCTDPAVGNVIGTEITVTAQETAEYIAAFNPDDTGSETVNEVVSPLVYAKDGTKLDITPSATKVGNIWQVSTDAESGDYKFLYWAKGLSTGVKRRIVSRSASFNYDAENEGNYLIAVYEKENMKTKGDEYYNANGQLLENGDTLPYLAGYVGAATGWEDRGDGMHVAIFPEENRAKYTITVDGTPKDYYYGEPVVCTADAEKDGKKFFGWRKTVNNAPAELVSANTSYTFNAWETCEVTAVYETEKAVFSGVARKIVLGTFNVGNETAIMAEFIGFGNDVVERGISLGGTEIAMTTKEYNQFTIINHDNVANISGYAILADGTKVIYNK